MSTMTPARTVDTADTVACICTQDVAMLVPEAAKLLGCSPEYLYAGLRSSRFPGAQVGRTWRMPRAFVQGFVRDVLTIGRPTSFEDYAATWLKQTHTRVAV